MNKSGKMRTVDPRDILVDAKNIDDALDNLGSTKNEFEASLKQACKAKSDRMREKLKADLKVEISMRDIERAAYLEARGRKPIARVGKDIQGYQLCTSTGGTHRVINQFTGRHTALVCMMSNAWRGTAWSYQGNDTFQSSEGRYLWVEPVTVSESDLDGCKSMAGLKPQNTHQANLSQI